MKTFVQVVNEKALNISIDRDNPESIGYRFGLSKQEAIELCMQLNVALARMEVIKQELEND